MNLPQDLFRIENNKLIKAQNPTGDWVEADLIAEK